MSFNPDKVKQSADEFVRENPEAAGPLIEILGAVADPRGDGDRYRLAWEIMRRVYVHTDDFEQCFKRYLAALNSSEKEGSSLLSASLH